MGEYRTILRYVQYLADGNSLPNTKFRQLKGVTDGVTEYEFKGKHLRLYAIQQPSKKIVIFLGYKNSQDEDITSFRSLKKQYLDYITKG
jgi:putative component of toxin-antitoxin plasmid stabilization module